MKYVLLLIFMLINQYAYSAEWISEAIAKITILKKLELPGGFTYSSFEISGAGKDNTGKQSTAVCVGHRIDKDNKLNEQKVYCQSHLSDGNKYSFMQIRKETDTDAGVGKLVILNGTGPYKKLVNKECIYAVSYLKDHAFVTTKCKVSNNVFKLLKNEWKLYYP